MLSFSVNRNLCQTSKATAPFQGSSGQIWNVTWGLETLYWRFGQTSKDELHIVHFLVGICLALSTFLSTTHADQMTQAIPTGISTFFHSAQAGLQLKKCCSKSGNGRRLQAFHRRASQGHDSTRYMRHEQESCLSWLLPCPVLWVSTATQTTAMTYHHRLSSTESSESTIPGVTLGIQLKQDGDMSMLP